MLTINLVFTYLQEPRQKPCRQWLHAKLQESRAGMQVLQGLCNDLTVALYFSVWKPIHLNPIRCAASENWLTGGNEFGFSWKRRYMD